ncbi:glycosyltransferase [Flagellimonas marinaquae]
MDKILFIVPSLKAGGLERVASILANAGVGNYQMSLVVLDAKKPFYKILTEVNLYLTPKTITEKTKLMRFFIQIQWLRQLVKQIKPNTVCSFGEKYNPFVLLSLWGLGLPVYVANRASPVTYMKGYKGLITPLAYKTARGVILQTQKSKELLRPRYPLRNSVVIGNPIDLAFPKGSRKNIILNVGSIGGAKNQDWLIDYFQKIAAAIPDWELHFVGDGSKREKCEGYAQSLDIRDRVVFHGIQRDVKRFYASASIFAFTSSSEGFPNALAEAMAAGCACIAYDCIAGPSDIIDDGLNGFLISEGNHELYVEKLSLLIADEDLRLRFGAAAREKMKQFEVGKISERFYSFITGSF